MQDSFSHELQCLLADKQITTLLQPIVNIDKKNVFGYEALSRGPSDSPLHPAPILFETAERCGLTLELESLCLRTAASSWSRYGIPQKLFVNVSPSKLMPSQFDTRRLQDLLTDYNLKACDIVIELSERYPTTDLTALQASLDWLRSEGFLIAIDDLGAGYSGLKLWSELKPDFVKIDRHFIRDIQNDLIKREFLRSVVELADRLNCTLIAEGVETGAELKVVAGLGISLVQGFLFGLPMAMPMANLEALTDQALKPVKPTLLESAGSLCQQIAPIAPDSSLQQAWTRMQNEPGLFALPVVENGHPLGLLHKWRVLEIFSTPYGRALNEKRDVTQLLSSDALVVDYDMPLEEISQRLIDEDVHYLKQHFVIVKEGQYAGLGATRSLLQQITERKIEKARYANPLTLLPGNVPIQKMLDKFTSERLAFTLIYFDINLFKPLNDVLGYRVGDQVILMLTNTLKRHFGEDTDFIGHIGGDDFVVISQSTSAVKSARSVQYAFECDSRRFYSDTVRHCGFVEADDRNGKMSQFPLVSLSAGILEISHDDRRTPNQLADAASLAKARAKAAPEFCFIERPTSISLPESAGSL